jgi:hypothetical protein
MYQESFIHLITGGVYSDILGIKVEIKGHRADLVGFYNFQDVFIVDYSKNGRSKVILEEYP